MESSWVRPTYLRCQISLADWEWRIPKHKNHFAETKIPGNFERQWQQQLIVRLARDRLPLGLLPLEWLLHSPMPLPGVARLSLMLCTQEFCGHSNYKFWIHDTWRSLSGWQYNSSCFVKVSQVRWLFDWVGFVIHISYSKKYSKIQIISAAGAWWQR